MRHIYSFICTISLLQTHAQLATTLPANKNYYIDKPVKLGLKSLATWGAINCISGLVLQSNTSGSDRYFHKMNIGWGAINSAIAGAGLLFYKEKNYPSNDKLLASIKRYQKIYAINAVLDVLYIGSGYIIRNNAQKPENVLRNKGFGNSFIMQGLGLFIYDGIMYLTMKNRKSKFMKSLQGVSFNGNNVSWSYNFY